MTNTGQTLGGRYQLGEIIGHGGMAEVYTGTDLRLGREVAVKVLRADLARDPAFLSRFRREAQSSAGLNHPNIVAVYDTGEDEIVSGLSSVMIPWIVMEKVDGMTLRQVLSTGHKISPERSLDIIDGVLAALDYSHRHGIVHRDIKPANIMLTHSGSVKVMDFGIARAMADASATMTHTNAVMGTAQYLSPEQARGEIVDARSDLYSTGCMLYELLTGQPPFTGDSPVAIAYQHVSARVIPPSEISSNCPTTFDTVVLNALAKAPSDRYHTAAEMRHDVQRLMAGEPTRALPTTPATDATQKIPVVEKQTQSSTVSTKRPNKTVLATAGAAVVAVVIGALILVSKLISPGDVPQVNVPDLSGLTVERAAVVLANTGLTLGETTYQESLDRPANTIISQNPVIDQLVDKGTAVDVVVSKGKDQVQVPTLVNFASPDDARVALSAVGLTLGAIDYKDSDLPAGTVLASTPAAGEYVDSGSAVSIQVSNGKVRVPNVLGMTEAEAKDELYNLGFTVSVITFEDDTVAAGTVIGQDPGSDKSIPGGSNVQITVSVLPPDPTDSPTPVA
jgi:serine/threonine-protein kinase